MQAPPPLPPSPLRRLLAIAQVDGWSIVIVAGAGTLLSLWQTSWLAAAAGALAGLAGLGELRGRRDLLQGRPRGLRWLAGSQLFLLAVIWSYAWCRWRFFDPQTLWQELPALARAEIDRQLTAAGLIPELDRPLLLQMMNSLVCLMLAIVSLVYQGGLALYYATRRRTVAEALLATPPPVS